MAKTIAVITGTALRPGVSANKRWYKPEHVTEAVRRAQERIKAGDKPMVMLTFHGADDNSREIAASLTGASLNERGEMDFEAGLVDTPAGWDIARLADTTDGKPAHLKNVSIRGAWVGRVRKERGPDGELAETADGVDLDGVDFTRSPGVAGAEIKTFDWVKEGVGETTERVLITESVREARVTITEEAAPGAAAAAPEGVREAVRALFGDHVAEGSTPSVSKRGSGLSDDTGRSYADPGYQADKKQRYDLSTRQAAKSAWSYINQPGNAKAYSAAQLKRVKGRIRAALVKFGVTVAAEGWSVDPPLLITEALAEYYGGDPGCAGSYSLSATNGPTTVTVCSWGLDPADLQQILAQACKGASMALCALDPDMDADVDVEGDQAESAPAETADRAEEIGARIAAAIRGESAEDPAAILAEALATETAVTETASPEDPAPEPAADREGTEGAPMSDATTTETVAPATAAAPAIPQDIMDEAMRKAAKKAAKRALAAAAPAESATPAAAPVAESAEDFQRRVDEAVAAKLAEERGAVAEQAAFDKAVEERLAAERQAITAAGGGPARKGLVAEHAGSAAATSGLPENFPMRNGSIIPMEEWNDDQRRAVGGQLEAYVLGSRAGA